MEKGFSDSASVITSPATYQFNVDYCLHDVDINDISRVDKIRLLITGAVQNRKELVKLLLDSPLWYQVTDADGNNLLQITIIKGRFETFEFLLSLPDFPLDHVNKKGQTALIIAATFSSSYFSSQNDIFLSKLVERGQSVNSLNYHVSGESLLHFAIRKRFVQFAIILMQLEHNVNEENEEGLRPLSLALTSEMPDFMMQDTLISALLAFGADPSVHHSVYNNFEFAVIHSFSKEIQDMFFFYLFDEHTYVDLHLEILLRFAARGNELMFKELLTHTKDVIVNFEDKDMWYIYYVTILCIELEYLKLLMEKSPDSIKANLRILGSMELDNTNVSHSICRKVSIQNLNFLLESHLEQDTIALIIKLNEICYIFEEYWMWALSSSAICEQFCFLLSYGYRLDELHLQRLYKVFGYGELVKILLHMDIKRCKETSINDAFLLFIYDVTLDLETYLENPISTKNVEKLLDFFSDSKLRQLCCVCNEDDEDVLAKIRRQPQIPSLVEIARNTFRKFFVKKFQIRKCDEFYSRLKALPISNHYRKIITYETKLYY